MPRPELEQFQKPKVPHTDHSGVLSSIEAAACMCIDSVGDGTVNNVTFVYEPCTTTGYGLANPRSATSSGTHVYTVQQCTGQACTPSTTSFNTTTTSQAVTGLSPATTYSFRVAATNAAGSTVSATLLYTTPRVPEEPSPPVALFVGTTEIKMSWRTSVDTSCSRCSPGSGPSANRTQCTLCDGNTVALLGLCTPCSSGRVANLDKTRCDDPQHGIPAII